MLTAALALAALVWLLRPYLDRLLSVLERRTAVLEALHARPEPPKKDDMPPDLLMWVRQESEEWARDQKRQYLADLRDQLGSWDKVRTALMGEALN